MFIYTYKLILSTLNLLQIPDVPGSNRWQWNERKMITWSSNMCLPTVHIVEFYLQKNCHIPRTCTIKNKTTDNAFTTKFLGIHIEFYMKCTNTSYKSK